jgi:hypothetical protein
MQYAGLLEPDDKTAAYQFIQKTMPTRMNTSHAYGRHPLFKGRTWAQLTTRQ